MAVGPCIGGLIIADRERFEIDLVMLGVVILGLVGLMMNAVAERAERPALAWRDG